MKKTTLSGNRQLWIVLLFITASALFAIQASARQQENNGVITGKITGSDGQPALGITIQLSGTRHRTLTDADGYYRLKAPAGNYTLVVTATGLQTEERAVTLNKGEMVEISFSLTMRTSELENVTVNSGFNKFSRKESDYIARMPLKNLENSQVYNVIPKELAQEQLVTDYTDMLRNITGGNASASNNSSNQSMLRGFRTFSGARNGMPAYTLVAIDPVNIERVEVIKGPSSTLFGSANGNLVTFGGLMNRVTKKPGDVLRGEITYTTGSWGLSRVTADINTPLNRDKTALLRVNTAYHTENSFQDAGYQRNFIIAPSFSYKASDRLTLLFDAEIYRTNRFLPANFQPGPAASFTIKNFKDLPLDYKNSLNSNDMVSRVGTTNFFAQANYRLSAQWTSTTLFSYTMTEYFDAYRLYLSWLSDSTVARAVMAQKPQRQIATSLQQNFNGDFTIGRLRNRLVAGLSYYQFTYNLRYTGVTVYDQVNIRVPGGHDFSRAKLDALLAGTRFNIQRGDEYAYSAYVSDVLNVTDQLLVMASLRGDRYDNKGVTLNDKRSGSYTQNALSPKLGIVYQPVKEKVSLFANYMNGFSNQGGADFNGNNFKPQQGNQWEAGVKLDIWHHRLNATLSYYHIAVNNVLRTDTAHAGFSVQDGTQRSRGFEAEIVANPFAGFNLLAGYGYNDNRYTRSNAAVQGKRPLGTPEHMANFWMSYKRPSGILKGWGFGFGGNYASQSFFNDANTFIIPASTILSATLFYEQLKWRLGVKVNNLGNQHYWSYIGAPQNPRQLVVNIAYKF